MYGEGSHYGGGGYSEDREMKMDWKHESSMKRSIKIGRIVLNNIYVGE